MVMAATAISFGVLLVVQARSEVDIGPTVGAVREVDVRITL